MASTFLRSDQALISAGVFDAHGVAVALPTGSWSIYQGGDIEAEDVFTRPGGMLPGQNLGGPSKRTDITVERQYTTALHAVVQQLESLAGKADAWASYTPLDANGNPNGDTHKISGVLKSVMVPNFDANSANAVFLGLVIGANTEASSVNN